MLVLGREVGERIVIGPLESIHAGEEIVVLVIDSRGDRVRLGIEAPRSIPIRRENARDHPGTG